MGCLKLTYNERQGTKENLFFSWGGARKKGYAEQKKCVSCYAFGFNGQEKDNEIKGIGNSVNYKYRMHDPRLGRFFAVDPLASEYPHNSVYAFSENMVIHAVELEGLEADVLYTVTPTDDIISAASDDIKNHPNVLTVVSHAGPHGARIVKNNKKGGLIDGPNTFNTEMTKKSDKWKNRKENGNLVVVMYGCNLARDRVKGGKKQSTRIQLISAGHPDQVFIGSETSVVFSDFMLWDEIKGPEDNGHWRVYKAGELIAEYPSSWNPNQYKSEWFDNPEEIKSKSRIPPSTGSTGNTLPPNNKKVEKEKVEKKKTN